jgi:hypothetical protein
MVSIPRHFSHPAPPLNLRFTPDLTTPMTPTSPGGSRSQQASPQPEAKSKKTNPLTELVETEKAYVDQLAGVIRVTSTDGLCSVFLRCADDLCLRFTQKVASAWSRSNLPPQELDQMFRAVEAVYKANRSLLSVRNRIRFQFI